MDIFVEYFNSFSNLQLAAFAYFSAISVIGFIMMGFDKIKAKKGEWRVREVTLIIVSLLGGALGTLIGMVVFRHKTSKPKFYIGVPLIYILNKLLGIIIFVYLK